MGLRIIVLKGTVCLCVPQRIVCPGIFLESNDGEDQKPWPCELHPRKLHFVGTGYPTSVLHQTNMLYSQDNPFLTTTSIFWKRRTNKTQNQATRTKAKQKQNKTRHSFACFGYNTWYPLNQVIHTMM